ncbi:hypothetical protein [Adhaeribacter aquaticus]|uniref:hypothetical protein n=1 Tax=Adhaeribacter aquaticus TaxID=299567 RepID=UPI000478DC7C|nr:hypothetical protein [Adhaeribacter aquaticus]
MAGLEVFLNIKRRKKLIFKNTFSDYSADKGFILNTFSNCLYLDCFTASSPENLFCAKNWNSLEAGIKIKRGKKRLFPPSFLCGLLINKNTRFSHQRKIWPRQII